MGNLCGKETSSHPFDAPGRTLGSGPGATALRTQKPPSSSARIPLSATANKPKPQDRTLSSGGPASPTADPRVAAAQAAEARNAKQGPSTGKLSAQLSKEKQKTQAQHLADASRANQHHEPLVWD